MNKEDFYKTTTADWKFLEYVSPEHEKQFIAEADFVSESLSAYKYTREGVYRISDHFTYRVATCCWTLNGREHLGRVVLAFCAWKDFERRLWTRNGVTGYWFHGNFYTEDGKIFDIPVVEK